MYTTSPRGTSDITSELFVIQEQSGNHVPQADFPLLIAVSRAFRSLRDEAPRKCGEFIGAGREFSFRDSLYTLCEGGMIRRSISMLLRAGCCHSIKSALCRHQRTVRYP